MHANLPGTPTEYLDVVGRPRGDVPANPEAIVQARRMLTDSLPKIVMNDADAAEGGCGVVGLACEIPIAGRHLFKSLEQMRNRGNGKGGGVAMVGLDPVQFGTTQDVLDSLSNRHCLGERWIPRGSGVEIHQSCFRCRPYLRHACVG